MLPFLHFRCLIFQLLAKLLKSKNPDDLQEANKLIKSMVKEVSGSWSSGRGPKKHVSTKQKLPQKPQACLVHLAPALN